MFFIMSLPFTPLELQEFPMMTANTSSANPVATNQWYLDLGATHHFTLDLAMMHLA